MKKIGLYCAGFSAILGIILSVYIYFLAQELPDVKTIETFIPNETTKIYSADGEVLAELHREEDRIWVDLDKISPQLKRAVVAVEDTEFYDHNGINPKAIMRALIVDIAARRFVQGGSTLTQQLARNLFLTRGKTLYRKLGEAILAVQIERNYTKDEILEMYLNYVYWGHNAYGIGAASQKYFGKQASDLKLNEAALLVGMLTGPELYSPFRNLQRCQTRQVVVLDRMAKVGIITEEEAQIAKIAPINLAERKRLKFKEAPYFTEYVVQQLIAMYGEEATYTSGMKVYTTLDLRLQRKAEELAVKYMKYGNRAYVIRGETFPSLNYTQIALLSLDPVTGYIKAMQGGVDFYENQFNRAVQAKRQPGSAFKPFVYLAALQKGFSPGSIVEDAPITFNTTEGPYAPQNYTQKYLGPLPLRAALEKSVNVVAIKLNHLVGPKNVVQVAHQVGIKSPLQPVLSLPLGANDVTMLELTSAYGVFANNGRLVPPVSILKIVDRDGNPLYENKHKEDKVFDSNLIATLVDMMKGVVNYGTGRNARLPRPVAGKTGTTSDYKDAWFVGFVPQLVTSVWVGNDDNTPMAKMTGGWVPAMVWKEFMTEALVNVPVYDFPKPTGMVSEKINIYTGNLATEYTPEDAISVEKYWRGKEPTEKDTYSDQKSKQKATAEEEDILEFFQR